MNIITDFEFKLDRNLVFGVMDCHNDTEIYEEVCKTYEILFKSIEKMLKPQGIFEFRENTGEMDAEDIKACSNVVYCLLTLGEKVTRETEKYFNEDQYLEGMLLDTMADVLLEEYSGQLYKRICMEAERKGLGLTCKLSPGNAFHISSQEHILDKLKGTEAIGVGITEGFMLKPLKSVSFIFGADKSLSIPSFTHECSRCTSINCKMRKEPFIEKGSEDTADITLIFNDSGEKTSIKAYKSKSILKNLIENKIEISSPCAGNGTCGKCRIKILKGKTKKLQNNSKLKKEELNSGWCLACSTFIEEDCVIYIDKKEQGFNILEAYESPKKDLNPAFKVLRIDVKREEIKGRSLTEIINSKLHFKYIYSLKALKKLSLFINSKDYAGRESLLYREEAFNLIVKDNKVLDVRRADDTRIYGIAGDIGTTTIVLSLIDLFSGENIKSFSMMNSQRQFGADVISRIQYGISGGLKALKECIKNDLIQGIGLICEDAKINPFDIYNIVLAGNTTMLYFVLGLPCDSLALFPFNTISTELMEFTFEEVFADNFSGAFITFLPAVSAYVGADIVSGMLQCGFDKLHKTCILIDIGTNGEMAIGNKDRILCLSTAAGPAFEGANITCGIASIKGAISEVFIEDGNVIYKTLGNIEPKGICGSGVIDITAECFKNSIIDETGRFDEDIYKEGYIKLACGRNGQDIIFNQKDVREVQLAKSAICSGIEILMKEYGCSTDSIDRVFLAGSFGNHMNIENAAIIGMIPKELKYKVKCVGNSSLGGATSFLLDEKNKGRLKNILEKTRYVDISSSSSFNDLFVENMLF